MADLSPLNFSPETTEDMGDAFKVIPPGTYAVVIVESDVADTKSGTGKILKLKYQIVEGPQVGNPLTDNLNIQNPSDTAQKIGLSQLKNICEAVGHVGQLTNSEQLHGKPFSIQVEVEKFKSNKADASGNFKDLESNKVAKRMKRTASVVAPTPPAGIEPKPEQRQQASW